MVLPDASTPDWYDPALLRIHEITAAADDAYDEDIVRAFPAPPPSDVNCMLHEKWIPSPLARHVAALFYMLHAYGVTHGEAMRRIIQAHNARMRALLTEEDRETIKRWRLREANLEFGIFTPAAEANAVANVALAGRPALDATCVARLLAAGFNRTDVFTALDMLRLGGAFTISDGAYNSKVLTSTGKIEVIYTAYLKRLRDGIVTLPGPDGEAA